MLSTVLAVVAGLFNGDVLALPPSSEFRDCVVYFLRENCDFSSEKTGRD